MVKKVILMFGLLILAGCSSAKKTENKEASASAATPPASAAGSENRTAPAKETAPAKVEKKAKVKAEAVTAAAGDCVSGNDKRTLEIKKTEAGGCELHYTKAGNTSTVATQVSGSEKCDSIKQQIISKLQAAGYTCSE